MIATCAPIFVVGSARSGTTLLYHILLSTGSYADYRGEPAVFDLLHPRYGDLRSRNARDRLLREWPRSHLARASGLDDARQCSALVSSVSGNGAFLRAVMDRIAMRQGVPRWAVWGPDNLLLMPWIKRELPDARFIHIVRDGRDVALSIGTEGWIRPFPWDAGAELLVAALHWQWKIRKGRADGDRMGSDYMELHFESLVSDRTRSLAKLSAFLGHDIDQSTVEGDPVGTLTNPNSTFAREGSPPIGRWRSRLSSDVLARVENAIGPTLEQFGYARSLPHHALASSAASLLYPAWFSAKHLLRTHTLLGRYADPRRLRLDQSRPVPPVDHRSTTSS